MSLIVTGQLDRITERTAGTPGREWTEQTLVIQDWGQTVFCTVSRDFGALPAPGERIAVNVVVRPFVRKDGNAGHGYTALGRNAEAEEALYGSRAASSPASL